MASLGNWASSNLVLLLTLPVMSILALIKGCCVGLLDILSLQSYLDSILLPQTFEIIHWQWWYTKAEHSLKYNSHRPIIFIFSFMQHFQI